MTQTLEPKTSTPTTRRDETTHRTPAERVDRWLADFESALRSRDIAAVTAMFATDCYWRDLVAFTWNLKTVEGREQLADMLTARLDDTAPESFSATETPSEDDGVVTAFLEFETATGRGEGLLRLRQAADDDRDEAWTLLTTLQELKGHEERRGASRVLGAVHGSEPDARSWAERREAEEAELGRTRQPYVLVVGGGQGGIALGARLRQLGVPSIVVDSHDRPGDQ